MRYPIDPEKYVQEMVAATGWSPNIEALARDHALFLNNAYYAGREGRGGYPMDPEAKWADVIKMVGSSSECQEFKRAIFNMVRLLNLAYDEGVMDREKKDRFLTGKLDKRMAG